MSRIHREFPTTPLSLEAGRVLGTVASCRPEASGGCNGLVFKPQPSKDLPFRILGPVRAHYLGALEAGETTYSDGSPKPATYRHDVVAP